jgi:hypothetical protein
MTWISPATMFLASITGGSHQTVGTEQRCGYYSSRHRSPARCVGAHAYHVDRLEGGVDELGNGRAQDEEAHVERPAPDALQFEAGVAVAALAVEELEPLAVTILSSADAELVVLDVLEDISNGLGVGGRSVEGRERGLDVGA